MSILKKMNISLAENLSHLIQDIDIYNQLVRH